MILGFLDLELSIVMKKLGTIGILSWLQPVVIWDFLSHDHPRKIYYIRQMGIWEIPIVPMRYLQLYSIWIIRN